MCQGRYSRLAQDRCCCAPPRRRLILCTCCLTSLTLQGQAGTKRARAEAAWQFFVSKHPGEHLCLLSICF